MERREFIKVASAAACAAALLPSLGGLATGCTRPFAIDGGHEGDNGKWDFDEIIDRSGTWSIKHERATEGQIPMWIADMDFRTAPAVSSALKERLSRDALGYTMTPEEYYQSIIGWEKEMHDWKAEKEWVAYCPGVITSINQAYLTFTNPGDSIIVMPPVYNLFRMYAERLGCKVIDNPLLFDGERYRMDLNGLERLLSDTDAKMLVLCNPHNPAGIIWDSEALRRIASLCRQKGVIVISDEIHADLTLPGYQHTPFCSVSDDAAAIGMVFAGPTKSFNLAGVSMTAYCVIPNKALREPYLKQLKDAKLDEAPIASLVATIAAYTEGAPWLLSLREYLQGNVREVVDFFSKQSLGIKAVPPQASFLVWLDCRAMGLSQEALMKFFSAQAGLLLSNGAMYGQGGEGFVRMNIGCPRSIVKEALGRIL
ncbi:MAG: pyridoxal phosphate-dependent aminotransferase [Bacteroidales bacterium]|nr:pyridoxal phosphate-dependent aminotransferase [Bacteroidales bacterium]